MARRRRARRSAEKQHAGGASRSRGSERSRISAKDFRAPCAGLPSRAALARCLLSVLILFVGVLGGCETSGEDGASEGDIEVFEAPLNRLPTLRELCLLQELRLTKVPEGMKLEVVSERVHTIEEIMAAMTSDPDSDGVRSLLDPEPQNPWASTWEHIQDRDGDGRPAWGDVDDEDPTVWRTGDPERDELPSFTNIGRVASQFESAEAFSEHYLERNRIEGLYPPDHLVAGAHVAGVDPTVCERWHAEFVEGE